MASNHSENMAAAALKRDKRDSNCSVVFICFITMGIIGLLYMTDLNTIIANAIGIVLAVIYNGAGSLLGWEDTTTEIISSNVKLILFGLFVIAGIGGVYSNHQNK